MEAPLAMAIDQQSIMFADASIRRAHAPRWKILLAMVLGRKTVGEDLGYRITVHHWRGRAYVTGIERLFQCAACGGVFDKGWSDAEATAERSANGFDDIDCAVVCDDCYIKVMQFNGHPPTGDADG
jgi:rubredoxin